MNRFQKVLEQLIQLFGQLTVVEQVKLEAASGRHVATVEECMTKEQAFILKLRGLEQEREQAQEEAGYGKMGFREILETVSEEERKELFPLFDGLSREVQMFQEVNEDAYKVIVTNLHMVERAMQAKEGTVYGQGGEKAQGDRHLTSRMI